MSEASHMVISLAQQQLRLYAGEQAFAHYPVSTARNGAGQQYNSGCTPLGQHVVRLRIGEDCPLNTVFRGRRPTGDIYTPALAEQSPDADWILTRILWLSGREPGVNRGGDVDTLRRFIYIHGCPDSEPMGVPLSHGCIRMRNHDLIALFDHSFNQMPVDIQA